MLPQTLNDLVPTYLTYQPAGMWPLFSNDTLTVHAGAPRTYLYYYFDSRRESWYISGELGNGPLPTPKPVPTRPALVGEELVFARLAEYVK
jgi:hypothetical protein